MPRSSRSTRRKRIRAFVNERDLAGLLDYAREEPDAATYALALAFDLDDRLRWRALEALGRLAAQLAAAGDLEKVRGLVRRVLWLMNDESGGIAWHGPEVLAELLQNVPALLGEYGRILASFIDEPPFGPGVHRALAKLAALAPQEFEHLRERLERSLSSADPVERGCGLLALSALSRRSAQAAAPRLRDDQGELQVYDEVVGEPRTVTVADLCRAVAAEPRAA